MIYPIIGIIVGWAIGTMLPAVYIPIGYSKIMGVALLAGLDTVFGGIRAAMEHNFDNTMFITGFFSNAALAALFVFVGSRLDIDLYFVALFMFGVRIFGNTAAIRRLFMDHRKIVKELQVSTDLKKKLIEKS